MVRQNINFKFGTLLFVALSLGCTGSFDKKPASEYDEANRQITVGNYNSAIAIMGQRLSDDPADQEARLILASAYAARAGIFMSEYIDVSYRIVVKIREAEAFLANHSNYLFDRLEKSAKDSSQRNLFSTFESIYRATYQINQLIGIFAIIPKLTEQNKKDLDVAVDLLSKDSDLRGGPILYRGVLRLALLKNNLSTKYDLTHMRNCKIQISKLSQQLSLLSQDVSAVMSDFFAGSTQRRRAEEISRGALNIESEFEGAIYSLRQLGINDEIDVTEMTSKLGGKCLK